ncbi:MAG: LysM peptidoglycan-binding domain-containing protein [Planctomycetes bacterium]|nr:LysM peptidoglycan-binding domain-containing protein [Planctomycetota bacterium]
MQHNPYINQDIRNPAASDGSSDVPRIGVRAYERARKLAQTQLEEGRYHDVLNTLSIFYKSQDLSPAEHAELLDLLDPLAAKVIYSTEHLVQPAHEVRRNETLMDIAEAYDVPWRLLQKINGIENPRVLLPRSQLKVVTGPFRAEVDVEARELTLFLGRLYAGRFAISVGSDAQPVAGDFQILDKLEDRDYFAADGRKIPAGDPSNPYGKVWMDIGRECAIHGSPPNGQDQRGCISLSPRDAEDVSSILSIGSTVRIYR